MDTILEETLLSVSVKLLLEKIVSADFVDKFRITELDFSLLKKLKTTLMWVQDILDDDVKAKQFTNPDVKNWLDMLRFAVFEVDSLFYEINSEATRRKVEAEYEVLISSSFVLKIIFYPLKQLNSQINSERKKLIERLGWLNPLVQQGGLGVFISNSVSHANSMLVDEYSIYGRDDDMKKLKHLLLSSDGDGKIRIISIVGMAGIGKTTLAKFLYNDPDVDDKFELRFWVHISKDFDILRVLETVLESINSQTISSYNLNSQPLESFSTKRNDTSDVNMLLVTHQQILSTRNFLLVLDDVWDAKSVDWIYLTDIFYARETGSRIIITTRDERVSLSMQSFQSIHYLRPMESEDCWSIVSRLTLRAYNQKEMKMVRKCDGLPLAAVVLGKALSHAKFAPDDELNYVLGSNIWELRDYTLKASLYSSYHYLSNPLKRCFAYCSIFQKKSILEKKMVVRLWVAEGLVESSTSQESWEKVGEEYFDELVSRSLIHRQSIDEEANR